MMPSFLFPEHSFRIVERQRRGTVAGTCMGREWGWHTKMNRTKRRREGGGGVASRRGTEKGALGQSAWPCHVGRRRPVLSSSAGGGRGARVECRCGLPMLDGGRGAGVERCGLPMTEGGGWSSPRQPVAAALGSSGVASQYGTMAASNGGGVGSWEHRRDASTDERLPVFTRNLNGHRAHQQ